MANPVKFTTPKGTLQWVSISGNGKTDLNGRQIFTADVKIPMETAQPLIDEIYAYWEDNKPKGAKDPKSTGFKEDGEGNVIFTLKTATSYPSGDNKIINVYDARARRTELGDKRIANGSEGRLAGAYSIYDAGVAARGVTMYLDSIQVTKLIEYTGGGASFPADDDGDFEGDNQFDDELV